MPSTGTDPRETVGGSAGVGRFGNDFSKNDARLQSIRMKIPRVLQGREHLSYDELEFLVCKLFQGV